jgi:hypothetical protein
LGSFLFTLKNPHNVAARRFALKADQKHAAIDCPSGLGPSFSHDIAVWDNCNAYAYSGLPKDTVLTGSIIFQGTEIEVFEITD